VYPGVPGHEEHYRRHRHKTPPLVRSEQHGDEENTCDDESMHINEMPYPRNAYGVSVSRCTFRLTGSDSMLVLPLSISLIEGAIPCPF
jgi:hypothetical protein